MKNSTNTAPIWILAIGLLAHLLASWFSVGFSYYDEHYQVLEFAAAKIGWGNISELPWEYSNRLRSFLMPSIVILESKFLGLLGLDSRRLLLFIFQASGALLGVLACRRLDKALPEIFPNFSDTAFKITRILIWTFAFVPFIHARTSQENWSSSFLIFGFCASAFSVRQGLFFSLAFLFRYQCALFFVPYYIVMLITKRTSVSQILKLAVSCASVFAVGILVDRFGYGEWTVTSWNYFHNQIILGNVNNFGRDPIYGYITLFADKISWPLAGTFIVLMLRFFKINSKNAVSLSILSFIVLHSLIAHKDLRYLHTIWFVFPLVLGQFFAEISNKWVLRIGYAANLILLFLYAFIPNRNPDVFRIDVHSRFPQGLSLVGVAKNPYQDIHPIYFSRPSPYHYEQISNWNDLALSTEPKMVFTDRPSDLPLEFLEKCKVVYQTIPTLPAFANINQWQERAVNWTLFDCK